MDVNENNAADISLSSSVPVDTMTCEVTPVRRKDISYQPLNNYTPNHGTPSHRAGSTPSHSISSAILTLSRPLSHYYHSTLRTPLHNIQSPFARRSNTPLSSASKQITLQQRNSLTCQLCTEYYTDPLMLPCLHSFCKRCLLQMITNSSSDVKCPTCGSSKGLSDESTVRQLPKNLWLAHQVEIASYEDKLYSQHTDVPCDRCVKQSNGFSVVFCTECCLFLCRSCCDDHKWCKDTVKHELIDVGKALKNKQSLVTATDTTTQATAHPIQHKPVKCTEHINENYNFFCQSCEELICQECMVHHHQGHEHVYLEQVASQYRHELQEWLDKCNHAMSDLDIAISNVREMYQLVQERKKTIEDDIDTNCQILHKALEERKQILREKCKDIATGKRDVLQSQLDDFQNIKEITEHTIETSSNAIMNQSPAEIVSTKRIILEQMKQAYSEYNKRCLNLSADDVITTSFNVGLVIERVSQFGSFTDLCIPDKSGVQYGIAIPYAIIGKERSLNIILRDDYGLPMKTTVPCHVTIKGIGERSLESLKVDLNQVQDGSTKICFTPQNKGTFELSVKVRSEPITGSPFRLYFREERNYRNLNNPQIFNVGQYTYGVSVHPCGDVFATNNVNGCIHVFNSDGTEKMKFGQIGSGNGQMNKPWGLAIGRNNVLHVVDRGNRRVLMFSINGESLGQFGAADLVDPMGICLDNNGHVFVTDGPKERVQVFTSDGVFTHTINCNTYPFDVAIDNTGHIHVSYYNNRSIQLFTNGSQQTTSGTPKRVSTSYPSMLSLLSLSPSNFRGASLSDIFTHQYRQTKSKYQTPIQSQTSSPVKDTTTQESTYYNNSCVQVFSPDGKHGLYSYSTNGNLVYPTGLAIDEEGYRFVTDSNYHCLRVIDPNDKEIHQCTGLNYPYGICIDTSGHVYIADSGNHRIVKY